MNQTYLRNTFNDGQWRTSSEIATACLSVVAPEVAIRTLRSKWKGKLPDWPQERLVHSGIVALVGRELGQLVREGWAEKRQLGDRIEYKILAEKLPSRRPKQYYPRSMWPPGLTEPPRERHATP